MSISFCTFLCFWENGKVDIIIPAMIANDQRIIKYPFCSVTWSTSLINAIKNRIAPDVNCWKNLVIPNAWTWFVNSKPHIQLRTVNIVVRLIPHINEITIHALQYSPMSRTKQVEIAVIVIQIIEKYIPTLLLNKSMIFPVSVDPKIWPTPATVIQTKELKNRSSNSAVALQINFVKNEAYTQKINEEVKIKTINFNVFGSIIAFKVSLIETAGGFDSASCCLLSWDRSLSSVNTFLKLCSFK